MQIIRIVNYRRPRAVRINGEIDRAFNSAVLFDVASVEHNRSAVAKAI